MFYFDNSATTKPLQEVMDTYLKVSIEMFGNPSSIHLVGVRARQLMSQARSQIAQLLQVNSEEIYFTSSGTESNNWVLTSVVEGSIKMRPQANRILISEIEHPSISEQMIRLRSRGFVVETIPVDGSGLIKIAEFEKMLDDRVLLISTMAVNNEVGAVQPLDKFSEILMRYPQIIWHVDGVQAVTTEFNCLLNQRIDAITLSGHKFHAGRGTGILMLRQRVTTEAFLTGGGQENGLRSGTENLASIAATAKALRLTVNELSKTKPRLQKYRNQIIEELHNHNWKVFSQNSGSVHIICAAYEGIPGEVLVHSFEDQEVMVSTTSACSSRKHQNHHTLGAMGVNESISKSAIRISLSQLTTDEEIKKLLLAITTVTQRFK